MYTAELVDRLADEVYSRLVPLLDPMRVIIGISNRHVHLSHEDLGILFGLDEFDVYKQVRQPGEFAALQQVTVHGPKTTFENVRCMGPCRRLTQVELSMTDCRTLGITAPVTQSGHLDQATLLDIEGPNGTITRRAGMVAARHIHMSDADARRLGVKDQDHVAVEFEGPRGGIGENFIIRTKDEWVPEIHLDTDEANAFGVVSGDFGRILR